MLALLLMVPLFSFVTYVTFVKSSPQHQPHFMVTSPTLHLNTCFLEVQLILLWNVCNVPWRLCDVAVKWVSYCSEVQVILSRDVAEKCLVMLSLSVSDVAVKCVLLLWSVGVLYAPPSLPPYLWMQYFHYYTVK